MTDTSMIVSLFIFLFVGQAIILIQYIRNKTAPDDDTPSTTETGPEVLVEDPMTERLARASIDMISEVDIQIPPPAYTRKDQHLEFSNNPPPPSFAAAMSSKSSSCSHSSYRRGLSRSSNCSTCINKNQRQNRRWSIHNLFQSSDNDRDSILLNSSTGSTRPRSLSLSVGHDATVDEPTSPQISDVTQRDAESSSISTNNTPDSLSTAPLEHISINMEPTCPPDYSPDPQELYQSTGTTDAMQNLRSIDAFLPSVAVYM